MVFWHSETERSSGWHTWYSLEMWNLVFNVSSEYQGSHPEDLSASVLGFWFQVQAKNGWGKLHPKKPHCVPMFIYISIAIVHINVILKNSIEYKHRHKLKVKNIAFVIPTITYKNDTHIQIHTKTKYTVRPWLLLDRSAGQCSHIVGLVTSIQRLKLHNISLIPDTLCCISIPQQWWSNKNWFLSWVYIVANFAQNFVSPVSAA